MRHGSEDGYVEPRLRKPGLLAIVLGIAIASIAVTSLGSAARERIESLWQEEPVDPRPAIRHAERVCQAAATHALVVIDTKATIDLSAPARAALIDASLAAMSGRPGALDRLRDVLDDHLFVKNYASGVSREYRDALRAGEEPGSPADIARDPRCTDVARYMVPGSG